MARGGDSTDKGPPRARRAARPGAGRAAPRRRRADRGRRRAAAEPAADRVHAAHAGARRATPSSACCSRAATRSASAKRYPVLYLLHGCCDYDVRGSQAWTTHGEAEQATDGPRPDRRHARRRARRLLHGLVQQRARRAAAWETYHLGQLIPWIDARFRTRAARSGRVVAGLSMGGFGAMTYAARHPDRFVAAASFSGAVDTNIPGPARRRARAPRTAARPASVCGPRATEEVRWRAHNPWDLAENLRGAAPRAARAATASAGELDERPGAARPGRGVDVRAVGQPARALRRARGSPHVWDDYGNGHAHAGRTGRASCGGRSPSFMRVLADPPAPPARVTYTAVEPRVRRSTAGG